MSYHTGIIIILILIIIYYNLYLSDISSNSPLHIQCLAINYLKSIKTEYLEIAWVLTQQFGLPEIIKDRMYWLDVSPHYQKIILLDKKEKQIITYMPIKLFAGYQNVEFSAESCKLKIAELLKLSAGCYDAAGKTIVFTSSDIKEMCIKTQHIKIAAGLLNKYTPAILKITNFTEID